MGGDAVSVAGEHDQDLRQHDQGDDLAEGGHCLAAFRVHQRQAEQDEGPGDAEGRVGGLSGRFGTRRNRLGRKQHLTEAEIDARQFLAENHKADGHKDEADHPGKQPKPPEGEAQEPKSCGNDPEGRIRRHAGKAGERRSPAPE